MFPVSHLTPCYFNILTNIPSNISIYIYIYYVVRICVLAASLLYCSTWYIIRSTIYSDQYVFSSHPFWTSSSLDVPAGVTQEEGHTGFLIHLPSAVRALIFVARRIQPFLSLVDREVEFCVLTN